MKDGNKMTFSTLFNTIYLASSAAASLVLCQGKTHFSSPCELVWESHFAVSQKNVLM